MTTLNFALTRALGRDARGRATRSSSRSSTTTRTSSPWLELARRPRRSSSASSTIHDDTTLDLDDLEPPALRPHARRRVPGRVERGRHAAPTCAAIAELAHEAGALAWADAVHYAPHGPIDVAACGRGRADLLAVQVLRPAPRARVRRARSCSSRWRPYKVRPAPDEPLGRRFETGTLPHELLAGFVAAVDYLDSIGWDAITRARARARRALPRRAPRRAARCTACRRWTAASPTFAFNVRGRLAARRPRRGSASAASRSGTATTTRSR